MSCYVRIGQVPMNATERGARGWQAFRRKRTVRVRYGKVIVTGAGYSSVSWAAPHWPREKTTSFRSEKAAKAHLNALTREKRGNQTGRGGAYERLPGGIRKGV